MYYFIISCCSGSIVIFWEYLLYSWQLPKVNTDPNKNGFKFFIMILNIVCNYYSYQLQLIRQIQQLEGQINNISKTKKSIKLREYLSKGEYLDKNKIQRLLDYKCQYLKQLDNKTMEKQANKPLIMPKHFVIKNGLLIPQDHINQIKDMNFRTIPYTHNIRFLYGNQTYQQIRGLQVMCQRLQKQIQMIKVIHHQEITHFKFILKDKESILKQQQIRIEKYSQVIKEKDIQIERLRKLLQKERPSGHQYTKNTERLIESQIQSHYNFNCRYQSLMSTKRSYLSGQNFINNINIDDDQGISQRLLKRVENSENILDQMLSSFQCLIKPNQYSKESLKIKTQGLQSDIKGGDQLKTSRSLQNQILTTRFYTEKGKCSIWKINTNKIQQSRIGNPEENIDSPNIKQSSIHNSIDYPPSEVQQAQKTKLFFKNSDFKYKSEFFSNNNFEGN